MLLNNAFMPRRQDPMHRFFHRTAFALLSIVMMAGGTAICLMDDEPFPVTVFGGLMIVAPSFIAVVNALRASSQSKMIKNAYRLIKQHDMQAQMARVKTDFGTLDELREGKVFKNL